MRRPRSSRKANRTGDIQKDLSRAQLAALGGATIAYNEAERLIDILLKSALDLDENIALALTGRINGVDGKIELAKIAMNSLEPPAKLTELLADSLGNAGFSLMKRYRDAVIHAAVLDAPAELGIAPGRRGKKVEVLLTEEALGGLFERLTMIRLELIDACRIASRLAIERKIKKTAESLRSVAPHLIALVDLGRSRIEPEIQAAMARLQRHQRRRLSLEPLPEFPDQSPIPPETEAPPVPTE